MRELLVGALFWWQVLQSWHSLAKLGCFILGKLQLLFFFFLSAFQGSQSFSFSLCDPASTPSKLRRRGQLLYRAAKHMLLDPSGLGAAASAASRIHCLLVQHEHCLTALPCSLQDAG